MDMSDPVLVAIGFALGLFVGFYFRDSVDWLLLWVKRRGRA